MSAASGGGTAGTASKWSEEQRGEGLGDQVGRGYTQANSVGGKGDEERERRRSGRRERVAKQAPNTHLSNNKGTEKTGGTRTGN